MLWTNINSYCWITLWSFLLAFFHAFYVVYQIERSLPKERRRNRKRSRRQSKKTHSEWKTILQQNETIYFVSPKNSDYGKGKLITLCSVQKDNVWRMKNRKKCNKKLFQKKNRLLDLVLRKQENENSNNDDDSDGQNEHTYNEIPMHTNYLFWLSCFFLNIFVALLLLSASVLRCIMAACVHSFFITIVILKLLNLLTFGVKSLIKFCVSFIFFSFDFLNTQHDIFLQRPRLF